MATTHWNIPGSDPFAESLRNASKYVDTETTITILTERGQSGTNAFALGAAVLESDATRLVPFYAAFDAIETVKRALDAGEVGLIYGCFGSFRVVRGTSGEDLKLDALLPLVALALDLLPTPVTSVYAKTAALFAADDAWFVTLRLADETIVTLEAMAACDPTAGRELLIEVTGSERVLRAEPFRQAVIVESLGGAPVSQSWWEDPLERFLTLLAVRAQNPPADEIARIRTVWKAMLESAQSGQRIQIGSNE